jgi:Zn-dependent protease with chaperone function
VTYLGLGLAFAAIGFLVANTTLSLAVVLLWRIARPVGCRARTLLALRLLPGVGALVVASAIVLPAFLFFEPRAGTERVTPGLLLLVLSAAALGAAGLGRGLRAVLATRSFLRSLGARSVRLAHLPIAVPVYRVSTALPLVAVIGVVRARLFVSERVLEALSAEELRAVLDHEAAHLAARDNLKRMLMRLTPDLLAFVRAGREIEDGWCAAAEEQADRHAAGPGGLRALDLAASLVKAARMMGTGTRPALPASNFCDGTRIARRVSRLVEGPPAPDRPVRAWIAAGTLVLLAGLVVARAELVLWTTYGLVETAVRSLQ